MTVIIQTLSNVAEEILDTNTDVLEMDVEFVHDMDDLVEEVQDYLSTKSSDVYLKFGRDWSFKNERDLIKYFVSKWM